MKPVKGTSELLKHARFRRDNWLSLFFDILGDKVYVSVYSYGH